MSDQGIETPSGLSVDRQLYGTESQPSVRRLSTRQWGVRHTSSRQARAEGARLRQLRRENFEVTGLITIAATIEDRIHVPSGAVLELTGDAADGVVVTAGGYAHISGTTDSLTVTVGGRATLTGRCNGAVVNDGGEVIIEGTVEGPITEYAGTTVIAPTASTQGPLRRC